MCVRVCVYSICLSVSICVSMCVCVWTSTQHNPSITFLSDMPLPLESAVLRVCACCWSADRNDPVQRVQLGVGMAANEDGNPVPMLLNPALHMGESVLMIAAGKHHTAMATDTGSVWTWGQGKFGALGAPRSCEDKRVPQSVPAALLGAERAVMVACGHSHTAALTESGVLFTWGLNTNGQLGNDSTQPQFSPTLVPPKRFAQQRISLVALGGSHCAALAGNGRLYMWGMVEHGQLGFDGSEDLLVPRLLKHQLPVTVASVSCGNMHTAACSLDGQLWTWGYGGMGQLGTNERHFRMPPTCVDLPHLHSRRAVMVACGNSHTCAVCHDGAFYSCGWNLHYQLGLGDGSVSCPPPPEFLCFKDDPPQYMFSTNNLSIVGRSVACRIKVRQGKGKDPHCSPTFSTFEMATIGGSLFSSKNRAL